MPLPPTTHFKESRNQFLWLGVVSLPHIKKKRKRRWTAGGWDGCMCLLRKPVGKNFLKAIYHKIKCSTQMPIFFLLSNYPKIIVYLRWEIEKTHKTVLFQKHFKLQSSIYIKYIYIYSQKNVHILGWKKHSIWRYTLYLKFLRRVGNQNIWKHKRDGNRRHLSKCINFCVLALKEK